MSTAVLVVPGITADIANESAWISVILSSIVGFIVLGIVNNLGMRFPRETLPQYAEILLGKILGKIVTGAYILFFLIISIIVGREFTDFITLNLMPETPSIVFNLFLVLIGAYAASKEIEVIARMTQFILPIFTLALTFLIGFALFDADFSHLLPFFDKGIPVVLKGSIVPAAWFGQIVVLVFLIPMTNKPQEVFKKSAYAILVTGLFLTTITAITITIFGPEQTGGLVFPFLYLAKYIKILGIQRLEYIVIFIWVSGIVIKTAVFYYIECFALVKVFSLKGKKTVIVILGILQVFLPNYLFHNPPEVGLFIKTYLPFISFFFELAIPLFLLFLAIIKRKKVRRLN